MIDDARALADQPLAHSVQRLQVELLRGLGGDELHRRALVAVLTYHVLPGKHSAADIEADIKKMNGKAEYKTVEGDTLAFSDKDGAVWVMDSSGNTAKVTIAAVNQSNGVIHVIDKVLIPKT